ncbi:hypothetical protein DB30_00024 [Enhygromyxa salina]|uniref:Uncharacterized protein n=1 Tax=Enhygromyxa salina TaxID=215803 RepID=A0A0C2DDJ0_9BACT|nr:hypothetical protein [Enhygromyxa salina]KIG19515.1 hypothetical protein DB30_00024 [Enhygromyxa salina]
MHKLQLLTFTALLCSVTTFGACLMADDQDPDVPDTRAAAVVDGASYQITTSAALTQDQLHAIAQFVESTGQDVHKAKVIVSDDENGTQTLSIEMWAGTLPGDEVADALRQEFGYLADAEIGVTPLGSANAPTPSDAGIEPGDDPETVKQKVIDDLRAQGVEGEINVTVTPTQDGHYDVEVDVSEHH